MSFVDRRIEARPSSGAAPFELNEVFFSRTDERGIILACNYVFQRVAHYEWDEILGAPHKLVRHGDTPKGLFHLFWETLKSGRTIGAYVKNKSKDGLYYWVFATVVPCEGGYLSARIKPSSKLFTEIQALYTKIVKAEKEGGLSPEESSQIMIDWVHEKGFDDYQHFASHALAEELIARDEGLGRKVDPQISELRDMLRNAEKLLDETHGLVKDFEAMHTIPHNLRVIASRIEPSGGPVTVLSQNYGAMSREMSDWFERNVMGENTNFATVKHSVNSSLFIAGMTRILMECDSQLQTERRDLGDVDMEDERRRLAELVKQQASFAQKGMAEVDIEAVRIINACQVMHRHFLGLSSTRVLCKIESARLPSSGETLSDIIDQLGAFQERISERLEHIAKLGEEIRSLEGE
ncbi:PAS domain-containing protein [Tritonibacter mobilis]|uniref:PAS domain-containing protein n=1 Tax=Tritonibacter mobilis TaxID=379347 RepID=UPI0014029124|nr:PAS domain-containing protein [Tritonibacter mobilis]NHM20089.1 PAS domain-containing protein [Tritonibacter mobilis]NHM24253.1 PAS domain-containing protein [Tritonibacter mobilis]